ncbi:MAG: Organic solvent tolerance ABC transporter substrate-binding protein [Candidatus Nitrospira kreftii]|uniref:Organic solvent tolerance ABC transporter substrate-binding protein n=1 Tax=Candidatus Nitrospira kreftii TaxID=2652173 RepID=A0A7S8FGP4_9BACT|nr:MAG: Organic solvent tolerance ABC transporter substrate-binding protein [Candidatus Nitrospira kreftii]
MMAMRVFKRGRASFHWGAIAFLAAVVVGSSVVPGYAGAPTEAMKATVDEVLRIVRDQDLKQKNNSDERRHLLEKVVSARFDYAEMSRRALGAPWNQLTDQQKQEFVDLFRTLLTNSYADKIETYSGEGVEYLNERMEKEYAEVRTKVLSGKTEIPLDYRLINKAEDWRVYDVVVDNISLVNNYRGQFTKILRASSYSDLVDQLRKKSEKLKAP